MTEYYVSQYLNIIDTHRNTAILFNGITGALDEVSRNLATILRDKITKGVILYSDNGHGIQKGELDYLAKRGHITTCDPEKECAAFCKYADKLREYVGRRQSDSGSIMMLVSYECNLACPYCYQNPIRSHNANSPMSPDLIEYVFTDGLNRLFPDVKNKNNISVILYGGEPFLRKNKASIANIIEYTTKHQMSVSAISNATCIDDHLAYMGNRPGKINSIQITFDGDRESHNKSRIFKGGRPTYDLIIANIHKLLKKNVSIKIRVNVQKQNIPVLSRLYEDLAREKIVGHPNVYIYAASIHNHFEQNKKMMLVPEIELAEYIKDNKIPFGSPLTRTINRLKPVFDSNGNIPIHRTSHCIQSMKQSYLLDSVGDLYSCYEDAGRPEYIIGHIDRDNGLKFNSCYKKYQSRTITQIDECKRCSLALTCGGGCATQVRERSGDVMQANCSSHKELVDIAIKSIFKELTENKKIDYGDDAMSLYPHL